MINASYRELVGIRVDDVHGCPPPAFPDNCPVCGAETAEGTWEPTSCWQEHIYACGGMYKPKPQIQNHTYN